MIKKGYYEDASGAVYEMINVARHAETTLEQVIYRDTQGELWVTSVSAWNEKVDGIPAFRLLDKQEGYLKYMLRRQAFHHKNDTKRAIEIKKHLRET